MSRIIKEGFGYSGTDQGMQRRSGPKLEMNRGPFPRALKAGLQAVADSRAISQFRELQRLESEGREGPEVDLLRKNVQGSLYVPPDGKDVPEGGGKGQGVSHSHQRFEHERTIR